MPVITDLYENNRRSTVESLIRECAESIEEFHQGAGGGREIQNTLVSILWGKEVLEYKEEILRVYSSCWSDASGLVAVAGEYSQEEIDEAVKISRMRNYSKETKVVRIAWFWDIMDDDFENYYATAENVQICIPFGCESKKVFFVFFNQSTRAFQQKSEERLKKLMAFSKENNVPLVLLADSTTAGGSFSRREQFAENYRLAANMLVLMNSYQNPVEAETKIGNRLTSLIAGGNLFSGAYYPCKKPTKDIAAVAIHTILSRYLRSDENRNENNGTESSVQRRICGAEGDYSTLIHTIFEQLLSSLCITNRRFWQDLPNTAEMEGFRNGFGAEARPRGFFSALFGGKNKTYSVEEAIFSVKGFWDGAVQRYYVRPVEEYLSSPEGENTVKQFFYEKLSEAFRLNEMNLLSEASLDVKAVSETVADHLVPPTAENFEDADALLHAMAQFEAKKKIARQLLEWLSVAMVEFGNYAGGFTDLLESVRGSIRLNQIENVTRERYGSYTESLLSDSPSILTRHIRPTSDETVLLDQLKETFMEMTRVDPQQVFFKSLQEDLEFRTLGGTASRVQETISECFRFAMPQNVRLPLQQTPSGFHYTILNRDTAEMINQNETSVIGDCLIVERSVHIERVFVCSIDPDHIWYSNPLA